MNEWRHECVHTYIHTGSKARVLIGKLDPPGRSSHAWANNKISQCFYSILAERSFLVKELTSDWWEELKWSVGPWFCPYFSFKRVIPTGSDKSCLTGWTCQAKPCLITVGEAGSPFTSLSSDRFAQQSPDLCVCSCIQADWSVVGWMKASWGIGNIRVKTSHRTLTLQGPKTWMTTRHWYLVEKSDTVENKAQRKDTKHQFHLSLWCRLLQSVLPWESKI